MRRSGGVHWLPSALFALAVLAKHLFTIYNILEYVSPSRRPAESAMASDFAGLVPIRISEQAETGRNRGDNLSASGCAQHKHAHLARTCPVEYSPLI